MARPLRIDQEDTFYHVLNRGNERRAIFRNEHDYEGFLDRLGRCSQRFGLRVFAYVLMGNHYHLLVKTGEANLSAAMQWLQVAYGSWHNRRHRRSGHLFQGRAARVGATPSASSEDSSENTVGEKRCEVGQVSHRPRLT